MSSGKLTLQKTTSGLPFIVSSVPAEVVSAVESRQDIAEEDGEDDNSAPDVNVADDQGDGKRAVDLM